MCANVMRVRECNYNCIYITNHKLYHVVEKFVAVSEFPSHHKSNVTGALPSLVPQTRDLLSIVYSMVNSEEPGT